MNLFDLMGRVAIVTGGNGGIGLGMCRGLADAGASVVVAGRNAEKGTKAVAELRENGGTAEFVPVDVDDEKSCHAMVATTVEKFGRLDILVNNAGISIRKQPEDFTIDEFKAVIETNLISAFVCCQAAYPELKKAGGGKIINIGSMMSLFGAAFATPYASSKGGIVQMTRSLACAWAKDNIQANAILPGWIDTDMTRMARQVVDGLYESVLARTPADTWGHIDDFAGIAVFLSSKASDFVTGTAIPVDGGYSIKA